MLFNTNTLFALNVCSDGEKLSEDDGKFITEKVFEYHPDKLAKVSDKINYILVKPQ